MRGIDMMLPARKLGEYAPLRAVTVLVFTMIAMLCAAVFSPVQAQSFRFTTIVIEGNQRVDDSTVAGFAGIAPGQTLDGAALNAAFTGISNSGLFESVELLPQGNTLVIRVREYPTIGIVNYEGNRRVDDEVLNGVVQTRSGRVLNPSVVEADARAIAEIYGIRGRVAAEVTPRIIPRGNNRVDLAFEIREGAVAEIERISFVGNRAYSNNRLRRVLETTQAGLLRRIIQSDTFVPERINLDRQLLTDFYTARGYIDFEILSATSEIARERDGFFLTFNLREGLQYRFGNLSVVSDVEGIDPAPYERELRLRTGNLYSPVVLDNNIARLEQIAVRNGLRFIRVDPRLTRNNRNQTIDVEFAIVRGEPLVIERIDIQGNTTTLDRVVRRQFTSAEGDPLNPREIRQAAERIRALGYFSDVAVEPRQGSGPNQAIVDVEVEETTTGSLGFSVAYSASEGPGFGIQFSETNFLGRGQRVAAAFNTVRGARDISLEFTEPAVLDRDLAYTLAVGYRESNTSFEEFDTREAFLRNSLGFPVSEFGRLSVRQGLLVNRVSGVQDEPNFSPRILVDETFGTSVVGSLGYTYSYDTRNNTLDPTRGYVLSFSQDFNVGNKSRQFIRTEARAGYEMAIFNEEVDLRADARAGIIHMVNGQSRYGERFQLSDNMRGFAPGGTGPRDFGFGADQALGGLRYATIQVEAEFPLGTPEEYGLRGGVFMDVGSVWGADGVNSGTGNTMFSPTEDSNNFHIRAAVGVSLFWDSPLGPLRFDFSRPIKKRPYDSEQNFDFSIVSRF